MRRVLLIVPILIVALVVWLAFFAGQEGGGGRGPRGGSADEAALTQDGDDAARRERRRTGDEEPEVARVERPRGTPFQQRYPEIGQDREQDPALGAMKGRVLVAQTTPAGGAVLETSLRGRAMARVNVDERGNFHLKNIPPGSGYSVVARLGAYAPGGLEGIAIAGGELTDIGGVYVGAAIGEGVDNHLRALVRAKGDGAPIEGAHVTASTVFYGALLTLGRLEKQPGGTILHAETDAAGEARIEMLPPGAYDIFVEAEGHTFQVHQRVTIQGDTKALHRFDLEPGLAIAGTVVTTDGEPIAGARVGGLRWGEFTAVPGVDTDEEGRFTLGGLRGGSYFVFAGKDDIGGQDMQNIAAGTTDLRIEVPLGGEIRLRVTDAESGEPLPKVALRPFRKMPFAYLYAPLFESEPGEDGVIAVRITSGDYGVEVSAAGYELQTLATVKVPSEKVMDVALEPAGMVRGRVLSKATGEPVAGADVFVKKGGFPPSRVKDLATVTDKDGSVALDRLAPRTLSLWISHVDHTETLFEGVVPHQRGDDEALPIVRDFALGSGGRIEGSVYDDQRLPIAGETMTLSSGFDVTASRSATTDAEGRYVFKNVPLDRAYTVTVGPFQPGRPGRSKSDVRVAEGTVITVDFGAEVGGVAVTGSVTRRGEAVGGASVSLIADDGGDAVFQARTQADGSFAFPAVPAGRYQVVAQRGGRITRDVTVGAEPPAPVALELPDQTISGVVVDAGTAEAMSGVYIECERVVSGGAGNLSRISQAWAGNTQTGDDGAFRISGVGDGAYRLRIQREGYGSVVTDDIVLAEGASRADLRFRLGAAGGVSGFVRTSAGTPVSGASLTILDAKGHAVFLVDINQSSSDGSFTADRLAPGRYTLTFGKDGYAPATRDVRVTADVVSDLEFVLLAGGTIDVSLRSSSGDAVAKAVIEILDAAGNRVTRSITLDDIFSTSAITTDANGHAVLRGVAAGTYRLRLKKGARTVTSDPLEVFEGGTTPLELQMDGAPAE